MKKHFLLLSGVSIVLIMATLLFVSFKPGEDADKGYATMRIYENFAIVNSKIIITYPDEQTEIIELQPFKYHDEYLKDNVITITKTLNSLRDKGYRIVSTSSSGKINSNKAMKITTIILEKE